MQCVRLHDLLWDRNHAIWRIRLSGSPLIHFQPDVPSEIRIHPIFCKHSTSLWMSNYRIHEGDSLHWIMRQHCICKEMLSWMSMVMRAGTAFRSHLFPHKDVPHLARLADSGLAGIFWIPSSSSRNPGGLEGITLLMQGARRAP
jgi:hypothetical protein